MRLQGAIFDMDGTLLDSMHVWETLSSTLLRQLGIQPEPDLDQRMRVMGMSQGAAYCRAHYGLDMTQEEIVAHITGLVETFYRTQVEAKPGVKALLSLLKMEGVGLYVATATDRPLALAALEHAGLWGMFQGMITCAEAGQGKDSPLIYEKALRRLRCRKEGVVVFEDSLRAIRTAKAAGFRVAGVADPSEPDQAAVEAESDYYITAFSDWTERLA